MTLQSPQPQNAQIKYMLFAFIGFTLWTMVDTSIRYLREYDIFVVTALMNLATIIFLLIASPWLGGVKQTITKPKLKLRVARGFVIALSNLCAFVAFANLDLPTAYAIIFLAPILAKVFAVILLKEQISMRSWLITAAGFVGVLIVLRPGIVPMNVGAVASVLLAILFSFGYVMGRKIGEESQTLLSFSLFQYVFAFVFTIPFAWADLSNVALIDIGIMLASGALAGCGSLLVSTAFTKAPSQYIAPIHYVQMLWALIFSAILFAEYPDLWTMIGGGVIILAGLALIYFSRKPPKVMAPHEPNLQ